MDGFRDLVGIMVSIYQYGMLKRGLKLMRSTWLTFVMANLILFVISFF